MEVHGIPRWKARCAMEFHGKLKNAIELHGIPWRPMVRHAWSSVAVESMASYVEFVTESALKFSIEYSVDFHGFPQFP